MHTRTRTRTRTSLRCLAVIGVAFTAAAVVGQTVPGFTVQEYAAPSGPLGMTFDPTGVMYVGHDLFYSGQGSHVDPAFIHQIGVGGAPVVEYGDVAIGDPDTVLYDGSGLISGMPGSVLVAGSNLAITEGSLYAIHPDESVHLLFGPDSMIENPNDLQFDSTGRLLIGDNDGEVYEYLGGSINLLFAAPTLGGGMAIDSLDRIFNANIDGVIRLYDSDGTLLDGSFYSGLHTGRAVSLAIGDSALWGTDLYTVHAGTGDLLRIDMTGNATVIGSGFADSERITADLKFGPDGALYASFLDENRIIRIIPEPSAMALLILGGLALLARRR